MTEVQGQGRDQCQGRGRDQGRDQGSMIETNCNYSVIHLIIIHVFSHRFHQYKRGGRGQGPSKDLSTWKFLLPFGIFKKKKGIVDENEAKIKYNEYKVLAFIHLLFIL